MSEKKPTPAQRRALEYVRDHGPCRLPWNTQLRVRLDVWERIRERGWVEIGDYGKHHLTDAGREVLR
jgi:hypothetical protein